MHIYTVCQLPKQSQCFVKHQKQLRPQNSYAIHERRTYQLFQPFYEQVVLDFVALDNHSHTARATGSKEMSMFVVCEDLSLVSHRGTTPACALDHHATGNKKFRLKTLQRMCTCMYHTGFDCHTIDMHLPEPVAAQQM